jgi:hypothetical protein
VQNSSCRSAKSGTCLAIVVIAALTGAGALANAVNLLSVDLPNYRKMEKAVWLEQNLSDENRNWLHHADQGTETFSIPYEWFVALEQPTFTLMAGAPLISPDYLDRFGFIAGSTDSGQSDLPIGFAHGQAVIDPTSGVTWQNPQTRQPMTTIGLTCAACHTGRLDYGNTTILIDGGPALTDLGKFRKAIILSLLFTRHAPFRFDRFAARVLGENADPGAKDELLAQLDNVIAEGSVEFNWDNAVRSKSVEEGFTRLDALNRIGNQVFGLDLNTVRNSTRQNYAPISAPVHFPRIWDAPWFDWVQYNGSIERPMVRNAGEALGVRARINLINPDRPYYTSAVQVGTLYKIQSLLAGHQPNMASGFTGLTSPRWPAEILPPIDQALASKGAQLYQARCQGCHLPPIGTAEFWDPKHWSEPNSAGERYLKLKLIDVDRIGTDPARVEDMINRRVATPAELGIATEQFGPALGQLVEKTIDVWYDSQTPPIPSIERETMNGNRANGLRAVFKYKARPLDGIWATPPYLHNGSVPTIYDLLSPVRERPKHFTLGDREYDPIHLGFRHDRKLSGGFAFDTTIRGNLNTGHEFDDAPESKGVIGPWLKPAERLAIIEYLKTL